MNHDKYGKRMTKKQVLECFKAYRDSFPDWSDEHDVVLTRACGPIEQRISLTALPNCAYRPMCTIALHLSIPDTCHILDQDLDIKHRQVYLRDHSAKWPAILKAMEEQFVPRIREPLTVDLVLRLAEEFVEVHGADRVNINFTTGLAALSAFTGNMPRAIFWCDYIQQQFANLGREPGGWEVRKAQFATELRQSIRDETVKDFLVVPK